MDPRPKCVPDFESNGARWVTIDEIMSTAPDSFRGRSTPQILRQFHENNVVDRASGAAAPTPATATATSKAAILPADDPAVVALNDVARHVTASSVNTREKFHAAVQAFAARVPPEFLPVRKQQRSRRPRQ